MFEDMKIPTLALVENMSYFICDAGKKYYPFGRGGRENILRGLGFLSDDSHSTTELAKRLQGIPP